MSAKVEEYNLLTKRAAFIFAAKLFAFVFNFFLPLFLVRRLSQNEFGLYKQVFLFVNTALTILPFSLGVSAFYFLPRETRNQSTIVFNILLFHLFTAGLVCLTLFLTPGLLAGLLNSKELLEFNKLIGIIVLTWVVPCFLEFVAAARQDIRWAGLYIVATNLSKSILFLFAGYVFGTVDALLAAAIVQGVIQVSLLLYYLRQNFGQGWNFSFRVMKMQLAYTLPYGFATMILYMETDIHYYFVSNQFGPAVFAIYAVGCFQIPLVEIISDAVGSVTLPRVSYLQKENRKREIFELIADMVRKIAAINFPILFFLLVFGREFIIVLFTSNYLASLPIFHINVLIIPLTIAACAYDPVLRAYPEHRFFVLKIRTLLILALLCVLWFTTTYFGLLATITAVVSVHAVERSLFAFKAARILELGWKDLVLLKDLPKLALAATFASIFSGLIKLVLHYEPIVLLGIGFVCFLFAYTISIIALGVLRKEEWEAVSHYFHYFTTTKKPADKPA